MNKVCTLKLQKFLREIKEKSMCNVILIEASKNIVKMLILCEFIYKFNAVPLISQKNFL